MNPADFLKKFKNFQEKISEAQEEMKHLRAEGSSGGDLIRVTINGSMETLSVYIDPVAVDPRDVKMLEELVGAAFTDAVRKMKDTMKEQMPGLAGHLPSDILE